MGKNLDDRRDRVYPIIEPLTRGLVRKRVHPNLITTSGFVVTGASLDADREAGRLSSRLFLEEVLPAVRASNA